MPRIAIQRKKVSELKGDVQELSLQLCEFEKIEGEVKANCTAEQRTTHEKLNKKR